MVKVKAGHSSINRNEGKLKEKIVFSFELKATDETIIAKVSGYNLLIFLKRFWGIIAVLAIIIFVFTGQITIEQLDKILNLMKAFN